VPLNHAQRNDDDYEDASKLRPANARAEPSASALRRLGVSLLSANDAVLTPVAGEITQCFSRPHLQPFARIDDAGVASIDVQVAFQACSVVANVSRRMWGVLVVGSGGSEVDVAGSTAARNMRRRSMEESLARRPSVGNKSYARKISTESSSEGFVPQDLVLYDRPCSLPFSFILVVDGGERMARDGGKAALIEAVTALVDTATSVTPYPHTVTVLLCRASRCLRVAVDLDATTSRRKLTRMLQAIEFRGSANMALGLELALSLVPAAKSCMIFVFNASPPPPKRSGARAIELVTKLWRARFEAAAQALPKAAFLRTSNETQDAPARGLNGAPPLMAFAFGIGDFADTTLLRVWCGRQGFGQFHWLRSHAALLAAVTSCTRDAMHLHAHTVVVRVEPESHSRIWSFVSQLPSEMKDGHCLLYIPKIASGACVHFPFQLQLSSQAALTMVRTLTVSVTVALANNGNRRASFARRISLPRMAVTAVNTMEAQLVHTELLRCQLADALQKAVYAAVGGDLKAAAFIIESVYSRVCELQSNARSHVLPTSPKGAPPPVRSLLNGGYAASPEPVPLISGEAQPFMVWFAHLLEISRLLFAQPSNTRVGCHVANAMLSCLALEHAPHWSLPPQFFAPAAVEPPHPYVRTYRAQSFAESAAFPASLSENEEISAPAAAAAAAAAANEEVAATASAASADAETERSSKKKRKKKTVNK
jgi:hypothetical protein